MGTHIGNEGSVAVGANTVAEVESWSWTETVATAEKSAIGDSYVARIAGIKDGNGSITVFWDETDTNGQEALTIGATVTVNLYPEGATSTDKYLTGSCIVTEVTTDVGGPNEMIKKTISVVSSTNSGVTWGTVA
jgi:hypothetical protein